SRFARKQIQRHCRLPPAPDRWEGQNQGGFLQQIHPSPTDRPGDEEPGRDRMALPYQSDQPTTVVWVRFDHPDYAKQPSLVATPAGPVRLPTGDKPHFRARLITKAGAETVL